MKKEEFNRNPEFEALKGIEGVDPSSIMAQAGLTPDVPPVEIPPVGTPLKIETPITEGGEVGKAGSPPIESAGMVPGQQDAFLKEIFGDRFKTVDEAKQANILATLDEAQSLREAKADLEAKLNLKPKTNFANDEVALYNEFVRETGIKDYGVFNRINTTDLVAMDAMDALVAKQILDRPDLAGKEVNVRKYFEKKYNVDPELVDEDELAINKIGMESDGAIARKALQSLKEKLVLPEPVADTSQPKELTKEEKEKLTTGWDSVGQQVSTTLAKLKVPIKNGKESLLDYEISDSEQKEIKDFISNYAVENQMELNETNVKMVSTMVYNQLLINKLPDIVHSVFEKARSLTEEQIHSLYENPSPVRNNDTPPSPRSTASTDFEKAQEDIFKAEMGL
jgi:hypothetical protein